ncbi:hypothetical protein TWF694_005150 [Orbilia ellipsospora]|uniref:CHAT domain-containing protein n=1 Tax=Orbilia ellipsospora TaxID=2528407 RepID=A0AAV9WVR1_9PEZI
MEASNMTSQMLSLLDVTLQNSGSAERHDAARILMVLSAMFEERFRSSGSTEDFNLAVQAAEVAANNTSEDLPGHVEILNALSNVLGERFENTGSIDDLDRAVRFAKMAIGSQDSPGHAARMNDLGIRLGARFERIGSMADLNGAIEAVTTAVAMTPQDDINQPTYLNNLGNWYGKRFQRTGSVADLTHAVELLQKAVTFQDYPNRADILNSFGNWLRTRSERTGSLDDLNHAIEVVDTVVTTAPPSHPELARWLNSLGSHLMARFNRTGLEDDLNRAIETTHMAMATISEDSPHRAMILNNLGRRHKARFLNTGAISDLHQAIENAYMAKSAIPKDHPQRIIILNNLSSHLGMRFQRTGSTDDLNRAIEAADVTVVEAPHNHPNRPGYLSNLSNQLGSRFQRTKSIADLDRAIETAELAVATTPEDHPEQGALLNNLGVWLESRFYQSNSVEDLDRAVETADMAVKLTPRDHPDCASRLSNLGNRLGTRFRHVGRIEDINRAVEVIEIALNSTSHAHSHPYRANFLLNFGNKLEALSRQTNSTNDLNRAISAYREGWLCETASPSIRIELARQAARTLAEQQDWEASAILLEDAVKLLPNVSPRSLDHTDKESVLAEFSGLASMAAAMSLQAGRDPSHSLRLLELGRGVIAGLLMDMRGDISDLEHQHPDLAAEFLSLRDSLDSQEHTTDSLILSDDGAISTSASRMNVRHELDRKFNQLIAAIRVEPGFDNFLLPPAETEIKEAARLGPVVVINLSLYRCDAFIVDRNEIKVLELPNLKLEDVRDQGQKLRTTNEVNIMPILEWLWDAICCPILEVLGFTDPVTDDNWPHIWWIPTGLLGQFPLHAAGYHDQSCADTVLDRVMSSYASSVKTLIHGRQRRVHNLEQEADQALLIAMEQTPNLSSLLFVKEEAQMLEKIYSSLQLKCVKPISQKDDIMRSLQDCKIFHFAGHGSSHPTEPSRSALLIEDWKLTVGDIRDCKFHNNQPFLSYLSACLTGVNENVGLVDEGIHLASAFQLAGFRHVIGTLWEVSDRHCVDMAWVVYETLRDEGLSDVAVCRGLHRAMRTLRDGNIPDSETRNATVLKNKSLRSIYWIPYIHFGV